MPQGEGVLSRRGEVCVSEMHVSRQRPAGRRDLALVECGVVLLDLVGHYLRRGVEEQAGVVVSELVLLFIPLFGHGLTESTAGCFEVLLRALDRSTDHASGNDQRYGCPSLRGI